MTSEISVRDSVDGIRTADLEIHRFRGLIAAECRDDLQSQTGLFHSISTSEGFGPFRNTVTLTQTHLTSAQVPLYCRVI